MALFGAVNTSTSLSRVIIISGSDFRNGVTAPTDVTIGTTPTVPAKRFDAVAELATANIAMPFDFDPADVQLILIQSLLNIQINGDAVDWTCNYIAVDNPSAAAHELFTKTSTSATGSTTINTTNGLAVATQYTTSINLDVADGSNPLSADTISLSVEIGLSNLVGVTGINLVAACLAYTAKY